MTQVSVDPFLRWAGGKRWLSKNLANILSQVLTGRYIEPFLGSGAVFFSMAPKSAILSDLNSELINTYRQVAKNPKDLVRHIRKIPVQKRVYNKLRSSESKGTLKRAIRFLYLNRTCYGGIYRENRKGKFNTPYGGGSRTTAILWEKELLTRASNLLSKPSVVMEVCDFETSIAKAREGDVIYCDPTYHPVTREQFNRYGATIFGWKDQMRLARMAKEATDKGAVFVLSNTFCREIEQLYPDSYKIRLEKNKSIGRVCKIHDSKYEYLIISDPYERFALWSELGRILEDRTASPSYPVEKFADELYKEAAVF